MELGRWIHVNQDITEQLYAARTAYQLWGQFRDIYQSTLAKVRAIEERSRHLLIELSLEDSAQEKLQTQLVETQESLRDLRVLQEDVLQVGGAADALATRMDSVTCVALQSHCRYLSGKVANLEQLLSGKKADIEDLMEQHEQFHKCLHTLETLVNESEEVLKSEDPGPEQVEGFCLETLKGHLLKLSSNSLRLEALKHLSSQLPLSDLDYRRVQGLHQRWEQARVTARDQCSKLQAAMLQELSFGQKCQQWRRFLEKMEATLTVDIASRSEGLEEQQETHEILQTEVSIAHQILDSVVHEARNLLPRGDDQERSTFILKLSGLWERWHRLVRKVHQRQDSICTLANQWRCYRNSRAKLQKLLTNTSKQLQNMAERSCYDLQQLSELAEDVKHRERNLQHHEPRYVRTLELGRELLSAADPTTQTSLEGQLSQLQQAWESTNLQLKAKITQLTNIEKMCDRCGQEVTELGVRLGEFGADMKKELPQSSEDLKREKNKLQEMGEPLRFWSKRLSELGRVKADLSEHLVPFAAAGFQEEVSILECLWEQLDVTVSLRRLEISDRLKQWVVFNTKNKQLEDWLKQMEARVSQNTGSGVEEMIERLQKDCMGEIKLYNRNKDQLSQLGGELIKASDTSKAPEIDNKLHLINSHWQHLLEVIEAR
ncbi:nesprin-2-like [Scyliorhinus canicula]|uniref:nesprin-2-like n=1 Tax=Scyliorhinus canicula TaxID=7830 RepID=UPI0018F55CA2|nr:nesprin-2-like [Scyliorhinus canicula]